MPTNREMRLQPEDGWPAGLMSALALFLLSRLYEGVQHDGVLYFGQVLHRGLAEQLANDPFFAGGSQDSYSLYSSLLRRLYGLSSPAHVHRALLHVSMAGLMLATWLLLRRLKLLPVFGLFAIATISPIYAGLQKFGFAENFITARTLAEPLVLFSLIPLAAGRLSAGFALQAAAALFHPLLALPACVLTWGLAVMRDRRWLWLLTPPCAGLAIAFLTDFSWAHRLVQIYDPYWWALVSQSNMQTVLANWELSDWLTTITDAAVIAAVARRLSDTGPRRLLFALLATAAALLTASVLATDGLHWVLPTQLQLWRVLGLVHLLALAVAPWLVCQLWNVGGTQRLSAGVAAVALLCSHCASDYGAPVLAAWALCALAAGRGWPVSQPLIRFGLGICLVSAVALSAAHLHFQLERQHWHPMPSQSVEAFALLLTEPIVAFALLALLLRFQRRGRVTAALTGLIGAGLLTFALLSWDQRSPLAHVIESAPATHPFQRWIPAGASVFWPEHLAAIWGLLRRVSHYVPQQGAGLLFNRATAEIIGPRREAYRRIRNEREACEIGAWVQRDSAQALAACLTPSPERLKELCSGAERPDYLVFEFQAAASAIASWDIGDQRFHLYRCDQFAPAAQSASVQEDRHAANS